jgi:hypothetical protein
MFADASSLHASLHRWLAAVRASAQLQQPVMEWAAVVAAIVDSVKTRRHHRLATHEELPPQRRPLRVLSERTMFHRGCTEEREYKDLGGASVDLQLEKAGGIGRGRQRAGLGRDRGRIAFANANLADGCCRGAFHLEESGNGRKKRWAGKNFWFRKQKLSCGEQSARPIPEWIPLVEDSDFRGGGVGDGGGGGGVRSVQTVVAAAASRVEVRVQAFGGQIHHRQVRGGQRWRGTEGGLAVRWMILDGRVIKGWRGVDRRPVAKGGH